MTFRVLLILSLAVVGAVFAHFSSAGSCGMGGVSLATQDAPKGECVCENALCLAATPSGCANCLMLAAMIPLEQSAVARPAEGEFTGADTRMSGRTTPPEQPPPEAS